jgi:hypothetical protein
MAYDSIQAQAGKINLDTVQTHIQKIWENAEVYKSVHGDQGYNELMVSLISKMTGSDKNAGTTPSSTATGVSSHDGAISLLEEDEEGISASGKINY